jgi:HTH-type transcriptional regulator / antitoxin HigA
MIPGIDEARSYAEMVAAVQPRLITNESEADEVQRIVDALVDQGPTSEDEIQLLRLLGGLIRLWEGNRYALPDISGPEAARALLRERGMKQSDLVPEVFSTSSVASEVLSGKRSMSLDTVRKLARFFHVPAAVFIEDPDLESGPPASVDIAEPRPASVRESAATFEPSLPRDTTDSSPNQETIHRLRSLAESLLASVDELERSYTERT